MRYIVRPASIHRTPYLIADRLGLQTRRYPGRTRFDWQQDFFLTYPVPNQVANHTLDYHSLFLFFCQDKAEQRYRLFNLGVPIPQTCFDANEAYLEPGTFIVRPLRHSGGRNYRITETPSDFVTGREYISRVFPKQAEYRAVYVRGQLTLLLKKRNRTNIPVEQPWNHANGSSFYTIQHPEQTKLATRSDCLNRLGALPIIFHAHIVAADILWHDDLGYVVCELNTCPGLSIPANLERVCNVISSAC